MLVNLGQQSEFRTKTMFPYLPGMFYFQILSDSYIKKGRGRGGGVEGEAVFFFNLPIC